MAAGGPAAGRGTDPPEPQLRHLPNLRGLGGTPVLGGGRVRAGALWRSDEPTLLEPDEVALLVHGLGIGLVIDLRDDSSPARGRGYPLADVGVQRVRLPISGWAPGTRLVGRLPAQIDLVEEYLRYLDHGAGALAEALRRIAYATTPVLVHCAVGKDRTGVLVALLLRLLGAADDVIVQDYTATHDRMPAVVDLWRAVLSGPAERLPTPPPALLEARPETMRTFLAGLDRRYPTGVGNWALDQGLAERDISALRGRLLE